MKKSELIAKVMMVKHENLESVLEENNLEVWETEEHETGEEHEETEECEASEECEESEECEMSGRGEVPFQVLEWWVESQTSKNWVGLSGWEAYLQSNEDCLEKRAWSRVQWAREQSYGVQCSTNSQHGAANLYQK